MIGELNLGGYKITNIANLLEAHDAVSKNYMDTKDAMYAKRDTSSTITDDLHMWCLMRLQMLMNLQTLRMLQLRHMLIMY